MDTQRPAKTLADYLVIAASPALIIVMVHSVCFFLVDIFYRGEAIGGVRWVLFWFVLAVVLIARIGIERGDGYAMLYGIALALATWFYLSTVQPNVLFGALLLAMVWFTAHKLTCNCTLIDEDADASGQGLLQSIFRLPQKFKKAAPAVKTQPAPQSPPTTTLLNRKGKTVKPQIPGIWLIYFSLAALPIFGLGQMLLPAGDMSARHRGFDYLFLYLAAALGLLVTTSFLGLRRYLRQRYLVMPGNIAFGWVQFGVAGAAIVLCVTLLLPRPGAGEAWGGLRYHVNYQLRRASEFAARFNPHGSGSGRAGNQTSPGSQSPQSRPGSSQNQGQNSSGGNQGNGKSSSHSKQGAPHGQESPGHPEEPSPTLSPPAGAIYHWIKILFWAVAAVALIWLLFRYHAAILMALRSAWEAIRKFIADLLGWFRPRSKALPQQTKSAAALSFKTFRNPFLAGEDRMWSPQKLIIYSYEALQSWAAEQDVTKGSPQTPRELCRQLGGEMPEASEALEHLAYLYGHVVYGASLPGQYHPERLRQLWDIMSNPRPARLRPEELAA